MGKRFLFLAILVNAVLIAISAGQSQADTKTAADARPTYCCDGGQCVQRPPYICMFKPSCEGNGDCVVTIAP